MIAEHLLNISETVFPGENPRESGFKEERDEPDNFFLPQQKDSAALSRHSWTRISIFGMVRRLREQRWCMVSNDAQYAYCYQFLREWLRNGETARLRSILDKRYSMPSGFQI